VPRVGYFYDPIFLNHATPQWHPERSERLRAVNAELRHRGLWERLVHTDPRDATVEEISAVHDPAYVEDLASRREGYVDGGDTYLSPGSFRAACRAAGAALKAVEGLAAKEIDRAFCAVRPPGHHAERDHAMGFCLFNNVAVAARFAQKKGFPTAAIVDFDVHHGNGTQHSFEEDPSVLYISTHQAPHYPGTGSGREQGRGAGSGFTVNFPLPAGTGPEELLDLYRGPVKERLEAFEPAILIVSAGYDLRLEDPLAGIGADSDTIRGIVRAILEAAPVPAIFSLEGGYDLEALADSVSVTVEELLDFELH